MGFFLNLEQAELLRIQRYNEAHRFYLNKQWLFKREDGEPLVSLNYFRKIIDKAAEFLVSKGFEIRTPEPVEQVTKPFLDEVWTYNKRDQLAWDVAITGGITGDVFILITFEEPTPMQKRVNPYSQGRIRLNLLGSEQVYPTWDPLNTDTLIAVRIETVYYAERGTRQLDRDDRANHEGRQLYTKRFTQIITRDQIIEQFHGDVPVVKPNLLGEIPLVHIKNMSVPKEYYGLSDGFDIIDPQRELNEKSTDISDIVNYYASPITIVYGAKAKQLERGPRQIWTGLPKDARVEVLKLEGDLTAARNYVDFVKKSMHELSDVPEGALGSMQPISNTSGVALHIQYQPLIGKTLRKRAQYEPGFEQINYFILRIGMAKGLIQLPFDVCKCCHGRIVEVESGETTEVWDPQQQTFVTTPVRKKRCYHVDKQTLEFLDPLEYRLKWWRQYGFGKELREMPYNAIVGEILHEKPSFWDYSVYQQQRLEKWQKAHPAPALPPGEEQSMGVGQEPVQAGPQPPPMTRIIQVPDGEVDIPEEPEEVTVVRKYLHPETGVVVKEVTEDRFLIPTGCKRPVYLNPFETKVHCRDVLPKDEALQAQLYQTYQSNGWVDEQWCQEHIPEIAVDAVEIRRRSKSANGVTAPSTTHMELAPKESDQASVPGPGGNPVNVTEQR